MTKTIQMPRHSRGSARRNALAAALLLCGVLLTCSSAGTMAYLTAISSDVNVFSFGKVLVELAETDTGIDSDGDGNTNEYRMLPADAVTKDPMVTIPAGSADSWVFVQLKESEGLDNYVSYELADGWNQLVDADGQLVAGVFWRQVDVLDADQAFPVLANNQVMVVADEQALKAISEGGTAPTLIVTAHAIQRAGFSDPLAAWEALDTSA